MATSLSKINHFVVLMLENRSFDHMLSQVRQKNVDAATPAMCNVDHNGADQHVTFDAAFVDDLYVDPGHDFVDVNFQLYANGYGPQGLVDDDTKKLLQVSKCDRKIPPGYILNYGRKPGNSVGHSRKIMSCFPRDALNVLNTLAESFVVCDKWFCSVPGPTLPNRMFLHAAQSDNRLDMAPTGYSDVCTIYDHLNDAIHDDGLPLSWKIYSEGGITLAATFNPVVLKCEQALQSFEQFKMDCSTNSLPNYSVIEPRYADYNDPERFIQLHSTDQHPNHDVRYGEILIADVYEALRASDLWPRSALFIVYDEHGGLFDHVVPPAAEPPFLGMKYIDPKHPMLTFEWDRLGPRVPAVLVSPWVNNCVDSVVRDHTSILKTVQQRWPTVKPLTRRDWRAIGFESLFTASEPNLGPTTLDRPTVSWNSASHRIRGESRLMSQHQAALVQLATHISNVIVPKRALLKTTTRLAAHAGCVAHAIDEPWSQEEKAEPKNERAHAVVTEQDSAVVMRQAILRLCPHLAGSI